MHAICPHRGRPLGRSLCAAFTVSLILLQGCSGGGGGGGGDPVGEREAVLNWNQIAIDATGLDHAPTNVGLPHTFGEQLGPCRASRAMAIVHVAIFDAVNAIEGGYQGYTSVYPAPGETSVRAAVAQAAHDTLAALYPSQGYIFAAALADELAAIEDGPAKSNGISLGETVAAVILLMASNDGSEHPEPLINTEFICGDQPGDWRQDPVSQHPLALGAHWYSVRPFVLPDPVQFRAPPPPALNSAEYTAAYEEAKALGGDGVQTPTSRTQEQTDIGIFWAYDGAPSLCAPPRLYNQIAVQIGERSESAIELARLLALVNVAMCEAGIASWESKYHYQFWRPVVGIRESDPGTGPSGLGDGNPNTIGDPGFMPLGAPASNSTGPNFTPPFPAYPSGHATFGGALFQVLRRFYGTDDIPFTFVSDEFNGVTLDPQGNPRPLMPRTFSTLSEAEEENGQSRIYLGIHWSFDKTAGIAQGRSVGDYVFENAFVPIPGQ